MRRILVGNKKDLEDQRDVSYDEGKGLAEHYGIKFFETSAKEVIQIEESFSSLAREVVAELDKKIEDEDKGGVLPPG